MKNYFNILGQSIFPEMNKDGIVIAYWSWPADLKSNLNSDGTVDTSKAISRTKEEYEAERESLCLA